MTDHPCKGMPNRAILAFEQIATGIALPAGTPNGIYAKLLERGVIERAGDKLLRDGLGDYSIPQYAVPLPVHMQWCEWCSEQPDIEGIA
jgi:hypothetical protein